MTEKRANEILRTKYPEATIFRRNSMGGTSSSRLAVTFKEGGKVYDYYASSYQEVLGKLGFNILYKHNVNTINKMIADLESQVEAGGEKNLFHLFDKRDWIPFTEEELESKRKEIERLKNELASSIIV